MLMLRNDLKRALLSKQMMISVGLGIIAIAVGMISIPIAAAARIYFGDSSDITDIQKWQLIYNCFNKATLWNFGNYYYFMVVPLMCSIPFSIAYLQDKERGYNKFQIIRGNYRKYLRSKYLATFVSGFLVVAFVTMIYFLTISMLDSGDEYRSIFSSGNLLGDLENNHFNLFVLVHGVIICCLGGVYSIVGLACSKISNNVLIGLASPFLLFNFMDYAMSIFDHYRYAPSTITQFYRLDPEELLVHPADILIQLIGLLVIMTVAFFIKTYWRNDNEYV